ncbi:2-keto-3-deoxy-phosphogalactonate aldolase [Serratia fonticola]|jgi:2-dehydro-3-deoxyphosphogalactonate aldolase|uniref:2-keto-3-deoxy-phosphogalactonate aldolase n=1 Tax=Serratia fonticola TaxID=47917 RepID=A0A542D8L9_SERFO|nr:2-dehydro-3-deoxy-6-phosphogalactonate aldolase [Serratia fonticola]TQI78542.1 2-keto-3-deoxy-phosphogalactonate aldolase [Serratia fonticola]TQI99435.1 2-keto-3-deoxy-phosphogalactonate aldolase [Serratia fonticola]TVZ68960.1 2-keto-3-deoxy-phosphogalactonate aldolase [Serratia fonticola]
MQPCKMPLVAILRGITPQEVVAHTEILVAVGFEMIEVPTNSPGWLESVQLLQQHYGQRVQVGAGTVVDEGKLDALIASQAALMVTPNTDPALIGRAKAAGLTTCIGAMTPTEVFTALAAGADVVKIFPAGSLGVDYIKALIGVLPPQTPLYAVGGVTPDNLAAFVAAGCTGAGLGSELYRAGQTPQQTRQKALGFIEAWQRIVG